MLLKQLFAFTTTPTGGTTVALACDDSTQTQTPSPWIGHAEHGRHVFSPSSSCVIPHAIATSDLVSLSLPITGLS